jgi:hypothetical protein
MEVKFKTNISVKMNTKQKWFDLPKQTGEAIETR